MLNEDGDHGAATVRVNQDDQGKRGHTALFADLIFDKKDIVLDRMNFDKAQRSRYLQVAKVHGYETEIVVLHESYETCLNRMKDRAGHPTIQDEETAKKVLYFFFTHYERVEDSEADVVKRIWPDGDKPTAVWSDLDGTLCDCDHRRHFVRREGKKDWVGFFNSMSEDTVNQPVMDILTRMSKDHNIVYCSGRPDDYAETTRRWLVANGAPSGDLFMRSKGDSRQDNIVKEVLLDFEVLTRFTTYFFLDDRDQVVKMLRNRGFKVFQVAEGNF
jgi:hypothetical protein